MKKRIIVAIALSCLLLTVQAQQEVLRTTARNASEKLKNAAPADTASGWKLSGISGVNFGQVTMKNWSAGGENTVSGNFYLNGSLNYTKNKWSWTNLLDLQHGLIYSEENNWRKNADNISFTSKIGYQINTKWSYAFLADFNSQFAKGYDYSVSTENYISNFMAPAYSNLALGFSYNPNNKYTLFFSPITARMTFVLDDSLSHIGAFGMNIDQKFRMEPGAYVMATTKQTVCENVEIISKLDMFTPYNERFGNIDVNWDLLVNLKINKFLTANLNTTVRYYEGEVKKVQFKEIFGLGFAYRF
jgi:hypothetical protein